MTKYIDAEKLKAEIERRKKENMYDELPTAIGRYYEDRDLLAFLSTLSEEPDSKEFTEEFDNYFLPRNREQKGRWGFADIFNLARHFAEWQKEQDTRDMFMSDNRHFNKVYELGKKDMKEQMLKDAVEGEIQMRYSGCLCAKTIRAINEDRFKLGDKVRIVVLKSEEEG